MLKRHLNVYKTNMQTHVYKALIIVTLLPCIHVAGVYIYKYNDVIQDWACFLSFRCRNLSLKLGTLSFIDFLHDGIVA